MVDDERRTAPAVTMQTKQFAGTVTLPDLCSQVMHGLERDRFMIVPGSWRATVHGLHGANLSDGCWPASRTGMVAQALRASLKQPRPATDTMPQQLDQIAFSVVDVRRTERWFRDAFGFVPAGGTRSFRGWGARHVQGLPGAASTCWWLVDRSEHFQIELFQFEAPLARLMPADYRPCDVGYSRVGFWVQDFDATLARLVGARHAAVDGSGRRGRASVVRASATPKVCSSR